jgi:hypothetical protein
MPRAGRPEGGSQEPALSTRSMALRNRSKGKVVLFNNFSHLGYSKSPNVTV